MPTAQEIQAWLASNPGATDRDIAAAMNQYGVSTGDLAGAMGWDGGVVQDRFNVAQAQNYIDSQWSGDGSLPGFGKAFTPAGTFDYGNDQRNWGVLGAGQAMGYDDAMMSRILGLPADQIAAYRQQYAPQVGIQESVFNADRNNPAPYMQPVTPTTNPASTLGATPGPNGAPSANTNPAYSYNPNFTPVPMAPGGDTFAGRNGPPGSGNPMINDLSQHGRAQSSPYGLGGPAAGVFGQMYGGYQASPWLSATADEIGRRTQQGLGQAFNQIRSNAVGIGGLGGSRQGVAQGIATRGAMDSLQGNLAGLFGSDWTQAQNRGLTARGQDQGFYTAQRGQDLAQLGLGADIYDMGIKGGWAPLQSANSIFNTTAGNNVTQTDSGKQGGGWLGALGGALGTAQLGKNFGWWGK